MSDQFQFKGGLTEYKVYQFLKTIKDLDQERKLYWAKRDEKFISLERFGFTEAVAKNEILSLAIEDYCSGPEPAHDGTGNVCIFGKKIKGQEFYIKLKIKEIASEKFGIIISFHPAEYQLFYPYKPSR